MAIRTTPPTPVAKPATATPVATPVKPAATPVATAQAAPASATKAPAERVAMRAYEKWLRRGCSHGHDVQDWIEAEKEVAAELTKGTTATMAGTARR